MNTLSKVAVITRTKNRPILLERAIKSVMGQSFEDLLMVVVNDGGDPGPIDMLVEKYEPKIIAIHNKASVGMAAATNVGISQSSSKYIAMLDDDDTWHKDFLRETIEYLDTHKSSGVVTASEIVYEKLEGKSIKVISREPFLPEMSSINLFLLLGKNRFPVHAFVYSRKSGEQIGSHDEQAAPVDDWDFSIRFANSFDIGFINKPLAYYHRRIDGKGPLANSIFIEDKNHENATNYILNKLMRQDLKSGKLGIGFIANLSNYLFEDVNRQNTALEEVNNRLSGDIKQLNDHFKALEDRLKIIEINSAPLEKRIKRYLRRLRGQK